MPEGLSQVLLNNPPTLWKTPTLVKEPLTVMCVPEFCTVNVPSVLDVASANEPFVFLAPVNQRFKAAPAVPVVKTGEPATVVVGPMNRVCPAPVPDPGPL
ncbi:MAG: hypothetical protein ACKONH_04550, partial [Planctomycetia bacterium]